MSESHSRKKKRNQKHQKSHTSLTETHSQQSKLYKQHLTNKIKKSSSTEKQ